MVRSAPSWSCATRASWPSRSRTSTRALAKYLPSVKVDVFYGGVPISANKKALKEATPHIVVGTPGRLKALIGSKDLNLSQAQALRHGRVRPPARGPRHAPRHPGDLPDDAAPEAGHDVLGDAPRKLAVCKKFCQDPMEIYVDDDTKLTLHGLQQHYVKLQEAEKNRKLNDLLGCARLQPGRDLRQQGRAGDGARPPADGVQLPVGLHPLGHGPGGAHLQIQGLQGLQEAHPRVYGPLWARHRHRARQHRRELRLPRGQGGQSPHRGVPINISTESAARAASARRAWPSASSRPRRTRTSWPRSSRASRSTLPSCRTRSTCSSTYRPRA